MSVPAASLVFDEHVPRGRSIIEHYASPEFGLGKHLLELADLCKGFRVIVVTPKLGTIMDAHVRDVKVRRPVREEGTPRIGSRHRTGWPIAIGSWRGYELFLDPYLEEPIAGYLAARVGGERLGVITLVKSAPQSWEMGDGRP